MVAVWLSCMGSHICLKNPSLHLAPWSSESSGKKGLLCVNRDLALGRGRLSPDNRDPKNFCQAAVMAMGKKEFLCFILPASVL